MTLLPHQSDLLAPFAGLSGKDLQRARILARAFRARWVPALNGCVMPPGVARRWLDLYSAGFTCAMRHGAWRFYREGRGMDRYEAVRVARGVGV
jgi:hypothetical protein